MNQVDLMVKCQNLEVGQCFVLPDYDMAEAAGGCMTSLLLDGHARPSDVKHFVSEIEQSWGVNTHQREMTGEWVICKPAPMPF